MFYHAPTFGVLDECTSAVSVDVEDYYMLVYCGLGVATVLIGGVRALKKRLKDERKSQNA